MNAVGAGLEPPIEPPSRLRGTIVLIAAVAAVALATRLGVWQLDRAAQKNALQAALLDRGALTPLTAATLPPTAAGAEAEHYRRIELSGRWLPEYTVFLDNRQMDDKAGFFVVTPLALDGQAGAVLVQRGWVARNFADRRVLPAVVSPPGRVSVAGSLAPAPSRMFEFAASASGPIRQNVDIAAFARETGLALRPVVVVQRLAAGEPPDGLARHWPPPATDVQKHYGYAAQWFGIAAGIAFLYVWYRLIRPRRRLARGG